MLSKQVRDVAEALATLENVTLALPALGSQLDEIIAKLERFHELADPAIGSLTDIFDGASLATQSLERLKFHQQQ